MMVSKERLMREFMKLVSFDSESYHEKEISIYLAARLQELGMTVSMDDAALKLGAGESAAGNLYAYLKGTAKGEPILFSAHMDTVSPGRGKKALQQPDGRITSDGTTVLGADDLTGIAAILEMLTVLQEHPLPHPDIEIIFFMAEEPYCRGSSVFDYSQVRSRRAYVLDLDGEIGTAANSAPTILQFRAAFTGKSAHAGFEPEKGVSAVSAAALAISGVKLGRIDDRTTANVGTVHGGTGKNIVPEKAVVEGEVRSSSDDRAREVIAQMRDIFYSASSHFGTALQFDIQEMLHAYQIPESSPVIRSYAKACADLGLDRPDIVSTFGGSDNSHLCANGIEGIVISNAMHAVHTTEEYFYPEELVKNTEILLQLATDTTEMGDRIQ